MNCSLILCRDSSCSPPSLCHPQEHVHYFIVHRPEMTKQLLSKANPPSSLLDLPSQFKNKLLITTLLKNFILLANVHPSYRVLVQTIVSKPAWDPVGASLNIKRITGPASCGSAACLLLGIGLTGHNLRLPNP